MTQEIYSLRRKHDDELRNHETRIREDEYTKYSNNLKLLEDKLSALEESRELASRKYYEMVRDIQTGEKQQNNELLDAQKESEVLKSENASCKHEIKELKILIEKYENDLKNKGK